MKTIYDVQKLLQRKSPVRHYYGDIVRKLFLTTAVIMLFMLPFFTNDIPISVHVALVIVLALSIFAGVTNPKELWVSLLNVIMSTVGVVLIGYYAIDAYTKYSLLSLYFWINQLLALLFLFALYYSTKTFRGFLLRDNENTFSE